MSLKILLVSLLVLQISDFTFGLDTNLKLVQTLFRHGDRAPVANYPTNPNTEEKWKKYGGYGELTQTGMKQLRDYGKYYKNRYDDFISDHYNILEVYATSTYVNRTIMSTLSFLSGLFPPTGFQKFAKNLDWQPIPVYQNNDRANRAFTPFDCPKNKKLLQEVFESEEFLNYVKENKEFLDFVSEKSGFKKFEFFNIWLVADTTLVERAHNLKLSPWITEEVFDKLMEVLQMGFYFQFSTTELAQMTAGGVLYDMNENIKSKIAGSNMKFYFYGLHDTYVAAMLKLLNMSDTINQPPYASSIILELRESNDKPGDYYVQFYLKNNTASEPITLRPLTVYGCDELCPYNKFSKIIQDLTIKDVRVACQIAEPKIKPKHKLNKHKRPKRSADTFVFIE